MKNCMFLSWAYLAVIGVALQLRQRLEHPAGEKRDCHLRASLGEVSMRAWIQNMASARPLEVVVEHGIRGRAWSHWTTVSVVEVEEGGGRGTGGAHTCVRYVCACERERAQKKAREREGGQGGSEEGRGRMEEERKSERDIETGGG
jgi:hypothetical protein